jgi:CrcB protein
LQAIQTILWISLGAMVGANLRYFTAQYAAKLFGLSFPYGTLIINVTGSFLLGVFLIWTTERVLVDPRWRLVIAIGFCGGYTTFSSFSYESFALFEQGQWLASALNILVTNAACLAAVILGAALARSL